MASRTIMLLALLLAVVICFVQAASLRTKRGASYGGGYGGYGNLYGPYYDKYDFYYGIPGFHVYSKYGTGDDYYTKAVFASEHGYNNNYGNSY